MSNWKAMEKKKQLEATKCSAPIAVWQQGGYPRREIWTRRKAKGAYDIFALLLVFVSLQFTKSPVFHTCFSFKCFSSFCFSWQPENILCVNREANQIKIIDFGLARRYVHVFSLIINELGNNEKKCCIPAMMCLIHNGLLLFLGQICFF